MRTTQALKFPVVATFAGESSRLLSSALKSQANPLLMVRMHESIETQYIVNLAQRAYWNSG